MSATVRAAAMARMDLRIDDLRAGRSATRAPFCLELLDPPQTRSNEWFARRAAAHGVRQRDAATGVAWIDLPPADSDRRGWENPGSSRVCCQPRACLSYGRCTQPGF